MCGRFASSLPPDEMRRVFATLGEIPNHPPSWNIAPSQGAMVIRCHPDTGERRLDVLRWGLVPSFTADLKAARKPINARSETVTTSPMFKMAMQSRRCLVPADAFYEWRADPDGKQPFAFSRRDGTTLAFAGLWEGWRGPDGEVLRTFTILTTAANALMAAIHDRMPVILEQADWPMWLGETEGNALALLRPAKDDVLQSRMVSRRVNSPRHDGAALLDPVSGPGPPQEEQEAGPASA